MATVNTILNTIRATNISKQRYSILIKTLATGTSPIFEKSGMIALEPEGSVEAEESRFDIQQLQNIANLKMLRYERLRRSVEITVSGGSTGSATP